ncbi:MAG: hypothetical protein GZ088_16060 [Acidipila sp.]|nr:hypothetical protein [Acidipila sp.]
MRTRWVIFLCLLSIAAAEAPLIYFAYQGEDVQPWITWGLVWYMVALECVVFGALAILFKVL